MFVAITLVGAALFAASLLIEKPRLAAAAPTADDPLLSALRLGGVVIGTLGLAGMAILNSVSVVPTF
jgi:hypothetical protein